MPERSEFSVGTRLMNEDQPRVITDRWIEAKRDMWKWERSLMDILWGR